MKTIKLPGFQGPEDFPLRFKEYVKPASAPFRFTRTAYAAAHVVADPAATVNPHEDVAVDWESTMAYRAHLWQCGLGVAEAMDTAQRGAGLSWEGAKELIKQSAALAKVTPDAKLVCGCSTDHLPVQDAVTLDKVIHAYLEQLEYIQKQDAQIVLMASRALAALANGPRDYHAVYRAVLSQVDQPVIIHWLGDMFDPALTGYWGAAEIDQAMSNCLEILEENQDKIEGIKISLLDAEREVEMRRKLPEGISMYTGDDFNFASLIAGDEKGYSNALLGIFDAIAPVASAALSRLAQQDLNTFHKLLSPTVPFSRELFRTPTRFYKTGVVFTAWLSGYQDHFIMLGGQQSMRSLQYFSEVFKLALPCGIFPDPELALHRMQTLLKMYGYH